MTTASALPRSAAIQTVAVTICNPADRAAPYLGASQFKQLMDAATSIADDDPTIAAWHYAPWAEGTCSRSSGVYRVMLFLAGRGRLDMPDNRSCYFEIDSAIWRRIASGA